MKDARRVEEKAVQRDAQKAASSVVMKAGERVEKMAEMMAEL